VGVLKTLLDSAAASGARNCVLAAGPSGAPEPLCGVYHRNCLPALERAIREKRFKMRDLVAEFEAQTQLVDPGALTNVNTPAEWAKFEEKQK